MSMKARIWAVLLALVVAGPALAQTTPVPTPVTKAPKNSLFTGYPYVGQGFYYGLNTMVGGGGVNTSGVTGANPNSVTSFAGAVGATVGYAWSTTNVFYAVEGIFDYTNLNGQNQGLALQGPLTLEQRVKIGTPLANVTNFFPNLGLPTVPPFPALPNGQTANNIHTYLMAGVHEDDITASYLGVTGRTWGIAPSVGLGMMGQLSNGLAADTWAEVVFPQNGVCIGEGGPLHCINQSTQYKIGFALLY